YGRMEWWLEYDQWQFRIARAGAIGLTCPRWLGFDLDGRAIMLEAHGGGNGDAIMFIRFAPELKRRGAAGLLARCEGVDAVLVPGMPPPPSARPFLELPATQAHLVSLPACLRVSLDSVPPAPYLSADPETIARWRSVVERIPGFRVGIAFQGNPG